MQTLFLRLLDQDDKQAALARAIADLGQGRESQVAHNEASHVFHLPALLQSSGVTLVDRIASWNARVAETDRQLAEHQREIDDIAFRLYGIEGEDRALLERHEAGFLPFAEGGPEPLEEDEP